MATCSFKRFSKKCCGASDRLPKQESYIIPLQTCTKDVRNHLKGCFKTSVIDLNGEWELCLLRAGFFEEEGFEMFTICPIHRAQFGLGWRPSKTCKHPAHDCKQKPVRGINKRTSKEIFQLWGVLCEIGQGMTYH